MRTLLLRLSAPLQAWGSNSKFETRTTEKMPTKSGVIGMLAAALGIRRDEKEKIIPLCKLKFGARADREGEDITDFHTAHAEKTSYITYRHYLSDAVFLVGLEGDEGLLTSLEHAIKNPKFPLFLGRRSCPPTLPIVIGMTDEPLLEALTNAEPLCEQSKSDALRIWLDTDDADAGTIQDLPISFDIRRREYGYRKVKEIVINKPSKETEHDAMSELE